MSLTDKIKNILPWVSLVASICTIVAFGWTVKQKINA